MELIKSNNIFIDELNLNNYSSEYYKWLNDEEVNKYLESRFKEHTNEDIKKYITQMLQSKNDYLFGIFLNSNNEHIGNIKVGGINHLHNFAEVGLMIGNKDCWGMGLGKEAIHCISEFSFSVLELNKLTAGMYEDNVGSYKSFLKVGFQHVGTLKNQYFFNGNYTDGLLVELFSGEYNKIKRK